MKRFTLNIITFIPLCVVIYGCAIYVFGVFSEEQSGNNIKYMRGGLGHTYSRLLDAEQVRDLDILFIGTSLTYRGFDTRIFKEQGIESFNLGTSGETPIQAELMLTKYLENLNPKLVIYEINTEWFGNNGSGAALDIISNSNPIDLAILKMVSRVPDIQVFNTTIYAIMKSIFDDDQFIESHEKYGQKYIKNGGFVESPIKFNTPEKFDERIQKIKPQQLESFVRSLKYLKKKNIPVILVRPPTTMSLYSSFSNNRELDSLFSTHGRYYNLNEEINLNDSLHFSDARHLNQNGVVKYNHFFIDLLRKENIIIN